MAERTPNKKWTEEDKINFLFQAVVKMQASGAKLPFADLKVTGRTPKALMCQWEKFQKEYGSGAAASGDGGAGAGAADPNAPAPPGKRGAAGNAKSTPAGLKRTADVANLDDNDGSAPPTPCPAPKRRTKAKAKSKALQPVDDDEAEGMVHGEA
ncbi:hypothetical protein F5Y10DRAFT_292861 [Nemania abortiva]|nr:hypothetical protein F5Y10DRAFT_292861 [Nemania abortiva]